MTDLLVVMDELGKNGFYPTPPELAREMLSGLDWHMIESVLEPSAGKGNLVEAIEAAYKNEYSRRDVSIDCIELNPDLRAILRGKGYRVVHDDFLAFHTSKRYNLIVMNPPFADGDKHLMKALELMKNGGTIVCLLNAQTLLNRHTNLRKLLWQKLTEYNASVTYFEDAFSNAERPADVSVAMVRVVVPCTTEASDIYEHMNKAHEYDETTYEAKELAPSEFLEQIIRLFEVETASGIELIRQYNNLKPYIMANVDPQATLNEPILQLTVGSSDRCRYAGCSVNDYLECTRAKYWRSLLSNDEFMGQLTSTLRSKYLAMVSELRHYDFSMFNIMRIADEMRSEMYQGVEDEIMALFEQFTTRHSWYPECSRNIHYYNGWATNKAHKINSKVIIPSYGLFPNWEWSKDTFKVYEAYNHLADIEKVFNYLDGHMTAEVDLHRTLETANRDGITKKIPCKYFDVTFYKKGTTHIVFRNQELLDKFNIYASRKQNWLPPCYGRKAYADMTSEEQAVIDEFQGRDAYEDVLKRSSYYLVETKTMLALPGAA